MMCSLSVHEQAKAIKDKDFPSRLFRYRSFDEKNQWMDWVKGTIYLSTASSFNDPFDCSFTIDIQIFRDNVIRKHILDFLKSHLRLSKADITRIEISEDPLQAAKIVLAHHCYHLGDEIDQVANFDYMGSHLQDIILVTCFSEVNDSILMWSHYANQHQGFCIEYDFRNDELLKEMTYPVIYGDKRVAYQVEPETVENSCIMSAVLSKSECWSYEHEWRFINIDPEKKGKQTKFFVNAPSCVRALYVGARVTDENMKLIRDVASSLSLPVYQMKMDATSFKLNNIRVL